MIKHTCHSLTLWLFTSTWAQRKENTKFKRGLPLNNLWHICTQYRIQTHNLVQIQRLIVVFTYSKSTTLWMEQILSVSCGRFWQNLTILCSASILRTHNTTKPMHNCSPPNLVFILTEFTLLVANFKLSNMFFQLGWWDGLIMSQLNIFLSHAMLGF